jgi:hypothetical protein
MAIQELQLQQGTLLSPSGRTDHVCVSSISNMQEVIAPNLLSTPGNESGIKRGGQDLTQAKGTEFARRTNPAHACQPSNVHGAACTSLPKQSFLTPREHLKPEDALLSVACGGTQAVQQVQLPTTSQSCSISLGPLNSPPNLAWAEIKPQAKVHMHSHVKRKHLAQNASKFPEPSLQDTQSMAARARGHAVEALAHRLPECAFRLHPSPFPLAGNCAGGTLHSREGSEREAHPFAYHGPAVAPLRFDPGSGQPVIGLADWDKRDTCSWLLQLRLEVTADEERAPLLSNPLRNGLLFHDLACTLLLLKNAAHDTHGRKLPPAAKPPMTLTEARRLLLQAFTLLGLRGRSRVHVGNPRSHLAGVPHDSSEIRAVAWSISPPQSGSNRCPGETPTPRCGSNVVSCHAQGIRKRTQSLMVDQGKYEARLMVVVESLLQGQGQLAWAVLTHVRVAWQSELARDAGMLAMAPPLPWLEGDSMQIAQHPCAAVIRSVLSCRCQGAASPCLQPCRNRRCSSAAPHRCCFGTAARNSTAHSLPCPSFTAFVEACSPALHSTSRRMPRRVCHSMGSGTGRSSTAY